MVLSAICCGWKIQEQQKSLDERQKSIDEQQKNLSGTSIEKLQRLLDGGTAMNTSIIGKPTVPSIVADTSAPIANAALDNPPAVTGSASNPATLASLVASLLDEDRYRDGMVIYENPRRRWHPFLAEIQRQYSNPISQHPDSEGTFTDHLESCQRC